LTGHQERPLEIFVEDDLALTLIKKICSEERLSKYVSIREYGAAINCFTSVCGSILNNLDNQDNMLFVLDGDEFKTDDEKRDGIKRVLTGSGPHHEAQRQIAFGRVSQFVLPPNARPERYYHSLICALDDGQLTAEELEIVIVAREIGNPGDDHKYFDDVIKRMDFIRDVGLSKLIDILSKTVEWTNIKLNIKNWLDQRRDDIIE
jgi:hypothetical protein